MSKLSELLNLLANDDITFDIVEALDEATKEVKDEDIKKLKKQWQEKLVKVGICPECGEKLGIRYVNAGSDQIPIGDHTETIYYTDAYKRCKSCGWDEEYDR